MTLLEEGAFEEDMDTDEDSAGTLEEEITTETGMDEETASEIGAEDDNTIGITLLDEGLEEDVPTMVALLEIGMNDEEGNDTLEDETSSEMGAEDDAFAELGFVEECADDDSTLDEGAFELCTRSTSISFSTSRVATEVPAVKSASSSNRTESPANS